MKIACSKVTESWNGNKQISAQSGHDSVLVLWVQFILPLFWLCWVSWGPSLIQPIMVGTFYISQSFFFLQGQSCHHHHFSRMLTGEPFLKIGSLAGWSDALSWAHFGCLRLNKDELSWSVFLIITHVRVRTQNGMKHKMSCKIGE